VFAAVSFAHQFTYQILELLILFVQYGIRVFHQKLRYIYIVYIGYNIFVQNINYVAAHFIFLVFVIDIIVCNIDCRNCTKLE
jgi:hypothetical protein